MEQFKLEFGPQSKSALIGVLLNFKIELCSRQKINFPSICRCFLQQQGLRPSDRLWSISVADLGIAMYGSVIVYCAVPQSNVVSPVFMPQRASDAFQHPPCALSLFRHLERTTSNGIQTLATPGITICRKDLKSQLVLHKNVTKHFFRNFVTTLRNKDIKI